MSKLNRVFGLVIFTYLGLNLALVLVQRNLIYLPPPYVKVDPHSAGLDYDEVEIPIGGNGNVLGWWAKGDKDSPTLLYFHGNGATLSSYVDVARIFRSYGWNALIIDYRGYGASSPISLSQTSVTQDGVGAYDWLIKQGISSETIFFWGHSLGAAIATQVAVQRRPRALILEGGFTSVYKMARYRYPWLAIMPFMVFDKFETLTTLRSFDMPLLVLIAENDEVIPGAMGREIFAQYSGDKKLVIAKGIGHNEFPSVEKLYHAQIDEFVNFAIK